MVILWRDERSCSVLLLGVAKLPEPDWLRIGVVGLEIMPAYDVSNLMSTVCAVGCGGKND